MDPTVSRLSADDASSEELLERIVELWPTAWLCLSYVQQLLDRYRAPEGDHTSVQPPPTANPRRLLASGTAPPIDEVSVDQIRRHGAPEILESYEWIREDLTRKQWQVVELLHGPEDLSAREVARRLGCSESTVSYHKKNAKRALDAHRQRIREEKLRMSRKFLE